MYSIIRMFGASRTISSSFFWQTGKDNRQAFLLNAACQRNGICAATDKFPHPKTAKTLITASNIKIMKIFLFPALSISILLHRRAMNCLAYKPSARLAAIRSSCFILLCICIAIVLTLPNAHPALISIFVTVLPSKEIAAVYAAKTLP